MGYGSEIVVAKGVKRPRIGYVELWNRCAPPDPGNSLGLWTWEVARRMRQSCDVFVCGPRVQTAPSREECEGVRFARFDLGLDDRLFRLVERMRRSRTLSRPYFVSSLYRFIFAARAAYALRVQGCEVIHIFNQSQFVPIVRRANPRSRIILNMQCDWLIELDRHLIGNHLRYVDQIVGCSDYVTEGIRKKFPNHAEQCMTVYNGVDTHTFFPRTVSRAERRGRVIFVNRISPEKGLHVLLEAFERVASQIPNATLEIVGPNTVLPKEVVVSLSNNPEVQELDRFYEGTYSEQLRQRVRGILNGRVFFLGPLLHDQLAERLRQADVLVQPSVFDEPFGIPIVEAMASGLPVVASAVGGIPELVVDGQTGLLVNRNDPSALAKALLRLLDDPALARAMGQAGRERVEGMFSWERIVDRLKLCYFDPLR